MRPISAPVCFAWVMRSAGISTVDASSRTSPVRSSSIRDSSMRAIRNVDGTIPDTSPEWSPSSTMSTLSVADAMPRSDVVTHIRS